MSLRSKFSAAAAALFLAATLPACSTAPSKTQSDLRLEKENSRIEQNRKDVLALISNRSVHELTDLIRPEMNKTIKDMESRAREGSLTLAEFKAAIETAPVNLVYNRWSSSSGPSGASTLRDTISSRIYRAARDVKVRLPDDLLFFMVQITKDESENTDPTDSGIFIDIVRDGNFTLLYSLQKQNGGKKLATKEEWTPRRLLSEASDSITTKAVLDTINFTKPEYKTESAIHAEVPVLQVLLQELEFNDQTKLEIAMEKAGEWGMSDEHRNRTYPEMKYILEQTEISREQRMTLLRRAATSGYEGNLRAVLESFGNIPDRDAYATAITALKAERKDPGSFQEDDKKRLVLANQLETELGAYQPSTDPALSR